jgi:hypothetical protein
MSDELTRVVASPDGKHVAIFCNIGEIRWGPPYFSLKVNDLSLGGRVFGSACLWSGDSRFLALQEWMTTDDRVGPVTQLVLVDVAGKKERPLAVANKGWVIPEKFEGDRLIYTEHYYSEEGQKITEFATRFLIADNWKSL